MTRLFPLARCVLAALSVAWAPAGLAAPADVPAFDVAYRAWDVVGDVARQRGDPSLRGECGRTFQAAAVPALRRQAKPERDAAAVACVQQARALCANAAAARPPETARKCEEFR